MLDSMSNRWVPASANSSNLNPSAVAFMVATSKFPGSLPNCNWVSAPAAAIPSIACFM